MNDPLSSSEDAIQPNPNGTPREKFHHFIRPVTDDEWQWLKEFVKENDHVARVSDISEVWNFRTGETWHPADCQFRLVTDA